VLISQLALPVAADTSILLQNAGPDNSPRSAPPDDSRDYGILGFKTSAYQPNSSIAHREKRARITVSSHEKSLKRIIDVLTSAAGLIILVPLILVIAFLIKREDGGAVLYRGVRVGRKGRLFKIYKFRTMVVGADQLGGPCTAENDPRITGIGRTLRKYKLDELPQLMNVLKGEMSLVGPRPEVEEYVRLYTEEEKMIMDVLPGITDWASIWNPDEGAFLAQYPDPDRAYMEILRPHKLELQKKYVQEMSLHTDLKILWMTIKALITRKTTDVPEGEET
jgi:lipopolysaccharide/colanic/teichoic acid biosynthesis glycosyltransferase